MSVRWRRPLRLLWAFGLLLAFGSCSSSRGANGAKGGAGGDVAGASGTSGGGGSGGSAGVTGGSGGSGGGGGSIDAGDAAADVPTTPPLQPLTWTRRTAPTTRDLRALASNGDLIVAVGTDVILTSTDGVTWTSQSLPANAATQFEAVAFGAGTFVAGGRESDLVTSPDGITWTKADVPVTRVFNGVTFALGRFFVTLTTAGEYYDSPDAVTWTRRLVPSNVATNDWSAMLSFSANGVVFASGAWSVAGHNWRSSNGTAWQPIPSWSSIAYDAAYGNGRFCVSAAYGEVRGSTDGTTWTKVSVPGGGGDTMHGVVFATDRFIVVSNTHGPFVSNDCFAWSTGADPPITDLPSSTLLYAIRLHKDKIIIVGFTGVILTAPLP